jgi:hypothetical protein
MRIAQLLEFQKEDFKQMSQQASNIQQGNGAVDSATQRQQRIAQLAANQQARNAAPPGRSQTPPATQSTSAVTQTAPVNLTATPQDTGGTPPQQQQQNAPMDPTLAQNLPGQEPPKTSFAQKVGGLAKGVGAVAGGVAGIGRAIKKGYNAGANAVGGPGYAQSGGGASAGGSGGSAGGGAGGGTGGNYDDEIANLKSTIQQMDQRLRRVGAE